MLDKYTEVAVEYYDVIAHPTCNNFRFLSEQFLADSLLALWSDETNDGPMLEVGAGRSIIAPLLQQLGRPLRNLILQDLSAAMLDHSREWLGSARKLIGDARKNSIADRSQSLVISSLGDPYNDHAFIDEMARIIASGGHFMITTPSNAWATVFRDHSLHSGAEFILRDGRSHYVPSITWDPGEYITAVEARGFSLRKFKAYQSKDVQGQLSPKLLVDEYEGSILEGYWFEKNHT